ncbi:MAG: MotA/TolQ/ExbB proton channel family protein [Candidatus Hydrogenedentota bacterium]
MRDVLIQWMDYTFEWFRLGGICMYPLLICSILALAIVIEKYISLRRKKVFPPEILTFISTMRGMEDINILKEIINNNHCCLSNILNVAIEECDSSPDLSREYIEEQARREVASLERGLGLLETIATAAPLLGLLGTVLGLQKVYTEIAAGGIGDPSRLSGGIYEALITTVFGLAIGIPSLVFYNYFESRVSIIVLEMEKCSSTVLRRLRKKREDEV